MHVLLRKRRETLEVDALTRRRRTRLLPEFCAIGALPDDVEVRRRNRRRDDVEGSDQLANSLSFV